MNARLKALLPMLPAILRDVVGTGGLALLSYGAWLVYRPAGFIVAGAIMLLIALIGAARDAAGAGPGPDGTNV